MEVINKVKELTSFFKLTYTKTFPESIDPDVKPDEDEYSNGYNLYTPDIVVIKPNEQVLVDTGIKLNLPNCFYGTIHKPYQIHPRTLSVGNDLYDINYDCPIIVSLKNNDTENDIVLPKNTRIAKMILHLNFTLRLDYKPIEEFNTPSIGDKPPNNESESPWDDDNILRG